VRSFFPNVFNAFRALMLVVMTLTADTFPFLRQCVD
jgi:hypothetical protein